MCVCTLCVCTLCVYVCVCVQALDWIQETGEVYLATHTSPGDSSEETQQLLSDYHHFRLSAKVTDQSCSCVGIRPDFQTTV